MAHEIACTFARPRHTSDGIRRRCSGIKVRTTSASVKDTRRSGRTDVGVGAVRLRPFMVLRVGGE